MGSTSSHFARFFDSLGWRDFFKLIPVDDSALGKPLHVGLSSYGAGDKNELPKRFHLID